MNDPHIAPFGGGSGGTLVSRHRRPFLAVTRAAAEGPCSRREGYSVALPPLLPGLVWKGRDWGMGERWLDKGREGAGEGGRGCEHSMKQFIIFSDP
jgi:hypothetical protein